MWNSLVHSVHVIIHWLNWSPGAGHFINLGRDRILGLGSKYFLSEELIAHLTLKRIIVLAQASISQDPVSSMETWMSNTELGVTSNLASKWECYCNSLNEVGVSLLDVVVSLLWAGGDSTGQLTVKNIYTTLLSTQDFPIWSGWKFKLWKWNIQLKLKLFLWMAVENKILSWEFLQKKGWQGPDFCPLCKNDVEDIDHLFLQCSFT